MDIFLNSIEIPGGFPHANENQRIFPWYTLFFFATDFPEHGGRISSHLKEYYNYFKNE